MNVFFQYLGIIFFVVILLYLTVGCLRCWRMYKMQDVQKTWRDISRAILLWPLSFWSV